MCLFGFLKHWAVFINRRIDPIWMGLCVGRTIFVYLQSRPISWKANSWRVRYEVFLTSTIFGATKETSKKISYYYFLKVKIISYCVEFDEHGKL